MMILVTLIIMMVILTFDHHDDRDNHEDYDDHNHNNCLDVGGRAVWGGVMAPINTIVETLHIQSIYRHGHNHHHLLHFSQLSVLDVAQL